MLTAAFCLLMLGADPVETFAGYPANENVLWVHLPKYTSRNGTTYTWEPKYRIGDDDSYGGAFAIDIPETRRFLITIMKDTKAKKRIGYVMTSTIAQERDDALAVSKALKEAEQKEAIREEERERWLYEKQLEVWRIRIEENKALSEQEKARALNRIANAINRL